MVEQKTFIQDNDIPKEFYQYIKLTGKERFFGHLKTVRIHRKNVRKGCFRIGLYWQGPVFRRRVLGSSVVH